MKTVFMGTPQFAVPCLEKLIETDGVLAVITQPDKPKGRRYKLIPTPVKLIASEKNIPVFQPAKLRGNEEIFDILKDLNPDVIIVTAFGQILPQEILSLPKYGCINIHASLLPLLRGAAPIHHAILNGMTETGITSMFMDIGLDTGDMLIKEKLQIGENETSDELSERMSNLGAEVLHKTLQALKNGTLTREKQDDSQMTYASIITKEMSQADFSKPARDVHNQIRAITAFTDYSGKRLKIYRSEITKDTTNNPKEFKAICGDGLAVKFLELQLEGSKKLDIKQFLNGNKGGIINER